MDFKIYRDHDTKRLLTCHECHQKVESVLHVELEGTGKSFDVCPKCTVKLVKHLEEYISGGDASGDNEM